MFTAMEIVQPTSIEEAYKILMTKKSNAVLGGCGYLRMGKKRIGTGIELSKLNLNYIKEDDEWFEIGAMTTFRDVETHESLNKYFNGVIAKSVGNIIGIQFRNVVTIGATVFSKYGFSDLITGFLCLNMEVELVGAGRMPLEDFLVLPYKKDLLVRVFIKKSNLKAVYKAMRNEASDYPILNTSVSEENGDWKLVVGARPSTARIAKKASEYLKGKEINEEIAIKAADIAVEELAFGTNMRGSKEYREDVCKVLLKRGIMEVSSWK